jgi:suppressor of tumorigenicity protein 13
LTQIQQKVGSEEHWTEITAALAPKHTIILQCTAAWCAPCQGLKDYINSIVGDYPKCVFARVDVDEVPELGELFEVETLPTTIVLKDGKQEKFGNDPDRILATAKAAK